MGRHESNKLPPPTPEEADAVAKVIGTLAHLTEAGHRRVLATVAGFYGIELNLRPQGPTCRTRGGRTGDGGAYSDRNANPLAHDAFGTGREVPVNLLAAVERERIMNTPPERLGVAPPESAVE